MSEKQAEQAQWQAEPKEKAQRPPRKPRPKMTMDEQIVFIRSLIERCKMHTGDMREFFAGEALLCLQQDDMLKLETVEQTLAVFELYKADEYVRREAYRRRGK